MPADPGLRRKVTVLVAVSALALLVGALPFAVFAQQTATSQPETGTPAPKGVPVKLDGDVLFYVYAGVGPLTAEERAEAVERRVRRIAEDPFYSTSEITVTEKGNTGQIFYRGTLVGVVTPEEAAKIGPGTTLEVTNYLVRRIARAIEAYRDRRQPVATRRAALRALLATVLLVGLLVGVRAIHRRLVRRVQASRAAAQQAAGVVKTMVGWLDKNASLQLGALRTARAVITVLLVAVYLLTIFDLFPLTRGYVISIVRYFVDPVLVIGKEFWDNIGNFIFIVVVVVLARVLLKVLRLLLSGAADGSISLPGVQSDLAMLLYKALRIIVLAIAAVMIYPYVPGSDSEAFKGIGLFAGALFTLGASGIAGNMIGGLALTFSGTFHIGDRVRIGDVIGDVTETTLLITRMRSLQNEIVTMPNSTILGGHVVNYSALARTQGLVLTTEVTIGYDAPWRKVHELMIDAALRTRNIVADPAPFVVQKSLNDYHISYVLWAYTRDASTMHLTYGELHQNIQDAFNEGGVEILSPAFSYLRDGNTTTIPAAYRAEGYKPEPFKVQVEERSSAVTRDMERPV